jgi:zinc-binding alcohol dehydrogenase family protein
MAPSTQTIDAVVTRSGGDLANPESLIDAQLPVPQATGRDLLVDVRAISVNPVDVKVRASHSPSGKDRVLGWDASGVVVAVGPDASLFTVGDEVYYAGDLTRDGSYATHQVVDERIVGRKPRTLSHPEAAALPLTTITAWEGLFDKLRLDATSAGTLLVVGGAGGVGSILIQLAKKLTSLRVIATASRPESQAWAREMGADEVVDHSADLEAQVRRVAPDGVEYIFTSQTQGKLPVFNAVIKPFGQIVAIDDEKDLDISSLKSKSVSWHWEFMFARSMHQAPDMVRQHELLNRVADLVDEGDLRTTLTETLSPFSADTVRRAHAIVEAGHAIGKVVISRD